MEKVTNKILNRTILMILGVGKDFVNSIQWALTIKGKIFN